MIRNVPIQQFISKLEVFNIITNLHFIGNHIKPIVCRLHLLDFIEKMPLGATIAAAAVSTTTWVANNAAWIDAVAGGISAGASVAGASSGFSTMSDSVRYMVEIDNFTDQPLELVRSEIHSGYVGAPPAPAIMPGEKESYNFHKGAGATGAIGAVAYRIGGSNNVAAITISCPYNFNWSSNTLALGIYQWEPKKVKRMTGNHIYNKMYWGTEVNKAESLTLKQTTLKLLDRPKEIWAAIKKGMKGRYVPLKRKCFYYDANPLQINDEAGEYLIRGTMGTNHTPTIKISLFPTDPNRLAPSLKQPSGPLS